MKITKLGHCCLLIETKGKRILTDPGSYTVEAHSKLENLDYILFTHEHQDHYHLESLKTILEKNPQAVVYTNNDWYRSEPWYRFVDPFEYLKGYKIMEHMRQTEPEA